MNFNRYKTSIELFGVTVLDAMRKTTMFRFFEFTREQLAQTAQNFAQIILLKFFKQFYVTCLIIKIFLEIPKTLNQFEKTKNGHVNNFFPI